MFNIAHVIKYRAISHKYLINAARVLLGPSVTFACLVIVLLANVQHVSAKEFVVDDTLSLLNAINDANNNPGADTISFDLPAGTQISQQNSQNLPDIDDDLTIDGSAVEGLSIEFLLNATGNEVQSSLFTVINADFTLKGLEIQLGGAALTDNASNGVISFQQEIQTPPLASAKTLTLALVTIIEQSTNLADGLISVVNLLETVPVSVMINDLTVLGADDNADFIQAVDDMNSSQSAVFLINSANANAEQGMSDSIQLNNVVMKDLALQGSFMLLSSVTAAVSLTDVVLENTLCSDFCGLGVLVDEGSISLDNVSLLNLKSFRSVDFSAGLLIASASSPELPTRADIIIDQTHIVGMEVEGGGESAGMYINTADNRLTISEANISANKVESGAAGFLLWGSNTESIQISNTDIVGNISTGLDGFSGFISNLTTASLSLDGVNIDANRGGAAGLGLELISLESFSEPIQPVLITINKSSVSDNRFLYLSQQPQAALLINNALMPAQNNVPHRIVIAASSITGNEPILQDSESEAHSAAPGIDAGAVQLFHSHQVGSNAVADALAPTEFLLFNSTVSHNVSQAGAGVQLSVRVPGNLIVSDAAPFVGPLGVGFITPSQTDGVAVGSLNPPVIVDGQAVINVYATINQGSKFVVIGFDDDAPAQMLATFNGVSYTFSDGFLQTDALFDFLSANQDTPIQFTAEAKAVDEGITDAAVPANALSTLHALVVNSTITDNKNILSSGGGGVATSVTTQLSLGDAIGLDNPNFIDIVADAPTTDNSLNETTERIKLSLVNSVIANNQLRASFDTNLQQWQGITTGVAGLDIDIGLGSYIDQFSHNLLSSLNETDLGFVAGTNQYAVLEEADNNLVDLDPQLNPLADNDAIGLLTQLPRSASPVINAGDNQLLALIDDYPVNPVLDQRQSLRISGGSIDMGAVEYQFDINDDELKPVDAGFSVSAIDDVDIAAGRVNQAVVVYVELFDEDLMLSDFNAKVSSDTSDLLSAVTINDGIQRDTILVFIIRLSSPETALGLAEVNVELGTEDDRRQLQFMVNITEAADSSSDELEGELTTAQNDNNEGDAETGLGRLPLVWLFACFLLLFFRRYSLLQKAVA